MDVPCVTRTQDRAPHQDARSGCRGGVCGALCRECGAATALGTACVAAAIPAINGTMRTAAAAPDYRRQLSALCWGAGCDVM